MDINSLLGEVVPAIGAAVGAYGVAVLNRAEEQAADATVHLGQRLLDRILHRTPDATPIEGAVTDLAGAVDDPDALAALRFQIRRVLAADPALATELAALLPEEPAVPGGGPRSVTVGGDVSGIVSTGDDAVNIQGQSR
ncbi:hypothetical protein [Streptomyces sp. cg2]|uniref:hypothetical protein n=1 Tax=Streptomyces sp. cg2 TaxID=3238799 RepID=UPI0034E20873